MGVIMMIIIFSCLGAAVGGIILTCVLKRRHSKKTSHMPPPLPPRKTNVSAGQSLPVRRQSGSATERTVGLNAGSGPRGLKPVQFPCCPYDKQRNVPGKQQVIFWDKSADCYRCSRGHQFQKNGSIL